MTYFSINERYLFFVRIFILSTDDLRVSTKQFLFFRELSSIHSFY